MVLTATILSFGDNKQQFKNKSIIFTAILILGLTITLFNLKVTSSRIEGEYFIQKAFKEQSRGRFPGMLTQLNKAENDFFTIDLTETPIDWYRGFAHYYSGSDSALFYFKKAEEQNPYHIQILSDIGAIMVNSGNYDEAIKYLKRALIIIPNYNEAHFNLAITYYNLNKPNEALNEINQVHMVGDAYSNALFAIVNLNAEKVSDSLKTEQAQLRLKKLLNDKSLLLKINTLAVEKNQSFTKLLIDSCKAPN
jgi:tetratricopeptide (TPR) repeat protein